jgi:hypothetical protein
MKVSWKGCCHRCHAPLDIKISAGNSEELLALATYLQYYPHPDFNQNQSRYKVCGPGVRRVCKQCYLNLNKMKEYYRSRNREIGRRTPVLCEPSLTHEELKTWFFDVLEPWIDQPNSEQIMNLNLKLLMSIAELEHFENI